MRRTKKKCNNDGIMHICCKERNGAHWKQKKNSKTISSYRNSFYCWHVLRALFNVKWKLKSWQIYVIEHFTLVRKRIGRWLLFKFTIKIFIFFCSFNKIANATLCIAIFLIQFKSLQALVEIPSQNRCKRAIVYLQIDCVDQINAFLFAYSALAVWLKTWIQRKQQQRRHNKWLNRLSI